MKMTTHKKTHSDKCPQESSDRVPPFLRPAETHTVLYAHLSGALCVDALLFTRAMPRPPGARGGRRNRLASLAPAASDGSRPFAYSFYEMPRRVIKQQKRDASISGAFIPLALL